MKVMIPTRPSSSVTYLSAILFTLSIILTGCTSPSAPRLRITNNGTAAIKNLTVLFPQDQVQFGDIPVDATTEYQDVPNGVYRYASYRLEVHGQPITVPVIDWVGEEPMEGSAFTYTLAVDPDRSLLGIVRLIDVTQDED